MSSPNLEILERNLESLLQRAYTPALPDADFRARLHARVLHELADPALEPVVQLEPKRPHRLRLVPAILVPLAAAALLFALFIDDSPDSSPPSLERILASGAVAWRPAKTEAWSPLSAPTDLRELETRAEFATPLALEEHPSLRASLANFPEAELSLGAESRLIADAQGEPSTLSIDLLAGSLRVDLGAPLTPPASAACRLEFPLASVRLSSGELSVEHRPATGLTDLLLVTGVAHVRTEGAWVPLRVGLVEHLVGGSLQRDPDELSDPAAVSSREEVAAAPTVPEPSEPVAAKPSVVLDVVAGSPAEPVREFRLVLFQDEDPYNVKTLLVSDVDLEDRTAVKLDGLQPGEYALDVVAPGHAAWRSPDFVVRAGETVALRAELESGLSVSGRVLDPDGNPLAGASVVSEAEALPAILAMDAATLERQVQRMATTDADGRFQLALLRSGQTVLRASHEDYAPGWSGFVQLGSKESVPELQIRMTRGGTLRGRVETEDGLPAEGQMMLASLSEMSGEQMRMSYREARTDAEGVYVLDRLPAGYYALLRFQDSASSPELSIVEVAEGEVIEFNFLPEFVGTRLFGRLTEEGGAPVARMGLSLARQDGTRWNEAEQAYAISDESGNYVFPAVQPGHYVIYITRDFGSTVVNIGEFDVPRELEFEHSLTLPGKSIEGIIRDAATGEPVRNGFVALYEIENPTDPGTFIGRQVTREDGRFLFHNVREYYYRVTAQSTAEGYGHEVIEEILPFESGSPVELALQRGGTIALRVTDLSGGPVAQAELTFLDENGLAVQFGVADQTDPDGSFTARGVRPGTWNVIARAEGFAPRTEICRVAAELTEQLELHLQPVPAASEKSSD